MVLGSSRALFGYSGVYPRLEGGQAELVLVPRADRCLWPIPEAVSNEDAVFVADSSQRPLTRESAAQAEWRRVEKSPEHARGRAQVAFFRSFDRFPKMEWLCFQQDGRFVRKNLLLDFLQA